MKTRAMPLVIFVALYGFFIGYMVYSIPGMPDPVASHFDAAGRPNGWMSRSSFVTFMAIFGMAFPLFVVGLSFVARFLPDSLQNIPRKAYWLAPERRDATFAYLLRHSLWFACMALCFVIGIYFSVIQANQQQYAVLSPAFILSLAGSFLAGTIIWGVMMLRRFRSST